MEPRDTPRNPDIVHTAGEMGKGCGFVKKDAAVGR